MRQVKIGDKWTFDDYELWLAPDSQIGEAEPKIEIIDIPYGDGSIDLTEALTGEVAFKNREISFDLSFPADNRTWNNIHKQLKTDAHGRRLNIVMPQYPKYIFNGRVRVGTLAVDNAVAKTNVQVDANPFMLKDSLTTVSVTVPASGSLSLNLKNERMTTLPEFAISVNCQIIFNGNTYSHAAGAFTLANIALKQGDNPITIKAAAGTTVKISYQEGAL